MRAQSNGVYKELVCNLLSVCVGGPTASQHLSGPQARVGGVQRVCAHHQELHQDVL